MFRRRTGSELNVIHVRNASIGVIALVHARLAISMPWVTRVLDIRYSAGMSGALRSIAGFACICLLAMQMSGLHLHVDADGHDAGLHGAHVHQAGPDDHDHSTDTDVSLLEQLGIGWSKLIPLLLIWAIVLAWVGWIQARLRTPPRQSTKVRHRHRWRPPLRAPPISP